jgi:hypothetical protein
LHSGYGGITEKDSGLVFANILLLAIAHQTLAFLKVLARVRTKNKPS